MPRPGASRSLFAPRSKQSRAPPNQCRPRRRLRSVSQQSGSGGANGARDGHVTKVAVAPNEWANTTQVPSRLWSARRTPCVMRRARAGRGRRIRIQLDVNPTADCAACDQRCDVSAGSQDACVVGCYFFRTADLLGTALPITKVCGSIFHPLILSRGCDPIECLPGKRASTARSSPGNKEM